MTTPTPMQAMAMHNGPTAAALVSAGLGCFLIGLLDILADLIKPLNKAFSLYTPAGALSGETTLAVVVWLAAWYILHRRWRLSTARFQKAIVAAYILLVAGILLTFPPIVHML